MCDHIVTSYYILNAYTTFVFYVMFNFSVHTLRDITESMNFATYNIICLLTERKIVIYLLYKLSFVNNHGIFRKRRQL